MATFKVQTPDGTIVPVEAPDGATEQQAIEFVAKTWKPAPKQQFGEKVDAAIGEIPRQTGLAARYAMEGLGNVGDFLATPIRMAGNLVSPNTFQPGAMTSLADRLGLPQPQNATERVVGDASRLVAGSMIPIAGGNKLADMASTKLQNVGNMLSSNSGKQLASATASGLAGGYTRETGGSPAAQFAASLAAGVAAPLAVTGGEKAVHATQSLMNRMFAKPETIDIVINKSLQDSGMTMADLPSNIQAGLRDDVKKAMTINGKMLSPEAVRRLADYRLTNTTPTAGGVTLDPAIVSQQKNLAKLGINSKNPEVQQLGRIENENNNQLIKGLNTLGADTADDAYTGGQKVIKALEAKNAQAKSVIDQAYTMARDTQGRGAALDPNYFATKANDLLDHNLVGGKLPGDVRSLLNDAATGKMPLTVDTAEQYKTLIATLQRNSKDGSERTALGLVRQALDETPLLNDGAGLGKSSIDAFNKGRQLNRSWMNIVEKTPALQAVRDGIEPDKFVNKFIIGSSANVADVAALKASIKGNTTAMQAVKNQITAYLKKSALNSAADEVGNFSQSAYNNALNAVGERKLSMFFSSEEINQLKAIGRVASYEQFQPRGSAVNNSNTAGSALASMLDRIGNLPILGKIPFGQSALIEPIQNISIGLKSKGVFDIPQSLTLPQYAGQLKQPEMAMSPAMFMQPDHKKKKGLLSPRP